MIIIIIIIIIIITLHEDDNNNNNNNNNNKDTGYNCFKCAANINSLCCKNKKVAVTGCHSTQSKLL